jgi:FKBP-type peptidyl-prolyl cis-trans isomerase SlyD
MNIANGSVVSMHYTLTDDDGQVLDSSAGRKPLDYMQGVGNIIPGLEKEMEGKAVGDKFTAVIPPAEGYGIRNENLVQTISLSKNFEDASQVQLGVQFQVQMQDAVRIATVTKIVGDSVTLDMNHPLADQTLHFDVEVMAIREATEEEKAHGHVHRHGHSH